MIANDPDGSKSSVSFEWMVRIPSYFTVTTIVTSLLMAPFTQHFGIVDDSYISGLGLSQSIVLSIFVAQQISFSLHTKAGLFGSMQREELSDFSDSWDIFSFKAVETPMRGDFDEMVEQQQNRHLSEIDNTDNNTTTTESLTDYTLPNFTGADLQDAIFWYLIIMFCFCVRCVYIRECVLA